MWGNFGLKKQSANIDPGVRFSKAPETFRARKAIFLLICINTVGYTAETSCVKGTSGCIKNMWIKQRVPYTSSENTFTQK